MKQRIGFLIVASLAFSIILTGISDDRVHISHDASAATIDGLPFKDVDSNAWYTGTLKWAWEEKMASGFPDGTFKPNKTVSEEEFLAMLVRAYKPVEHSNVPKTGHWSDSYYRFAALQNYPVTNQKSKPITRNKVAEIIAGASERNYLGDNAAHFLLQKEYAKGKIPGVVSVKSYKGQDSLTRVEALQFIKNVKEKGLSQLGIRPITPSNVGDLSPLPEFAIPFLPQVNIDSSILGSDGKIKQELVKRYVQDSQKSLKFMDNKLRGLLPALPTGLDYSLAFYVKYDPKYKVNAKNSEFLSHGKSFIPGKDFAIDVDWDKVVSGTFKISVVDKRTNSNVYGILTNYPSMKITEF